MVVFLQWPVSWPSETEASFKAAYLSSTGEEIQQDAPIVGASRVVGSSRCSLAQAGELASQYPDLIVSEEFPDP